MPEYIKRESLLETAKELAKGSFSTPLIIAAIENAPKADVVEVVRCKDCVNSREMDKYEKNLYVSGCVGCTLHSKSYHSVIMEGDSFCSYGERKEGAEE